LINWKNETKGYYKRFRGLCIGLDHNCCPDLVPFYTQTDKNVCVMKKIYEKLTEMPTPVQWLLWFVLGALSHAILYSL
jgi:hypothetical protein